MKIQGLKIAGAAAIALFAAAAPAHAADVIDWASWGNVSGNTVTGTTAGGVTVTYTGDFDDVVSGYPSWTPSTSYTGGTIGNAPVPSDNIIRMEGGNKDLNTITFSQALINPVIAIWSLGQGGVDAQFDFNAPFTVEAGGPSAEYGGSGITSGGDTVFGSEGNGVIQFQGTFTSISFTNPVNEYWYGFVVGNDLSAAVPEPATWAMFLLGFGAIGWSLRSSPARRMAAVRA